MMAGRPVNSFYGHGKTPYVPPHVRKNRHVRNVQQDFRDSDVEESDEDSNELDMPVIMFCQYIRQDDGSGDDSDVAEGSGDDLAVGEGTEDDFPEHEEGEEWSESTENSDIDNDEHDFDIQPKMKVPKRSLPTRKGKQSITKPTTSSNDNKNTKDIPTTSSNNNHSAKTSNKNQKGQVKLTTDKDEHFRWRRRSPLKVDATFLGDPFPDPPEDDLNPIEYFKCFFDDELIDDLVQETNLYSLQKTGSSIKVGHDEMEQYLGILIYMAIIKLPNVRMYWSTGTRIPGIADVMSASRRFVSTSIVMTMLKN